jgi:hypothetical protein
MTNSYNIAGTDGSVLVPVLNQTGSVMAWMLYPNPSGVLQDYYPELSIPVPASELSQRFSLQRNTYPDSIQYGALYQGIPFIHKRSFGWTGQPIIQSSKIKNMATTVSSNGVSADRIKNDPLFERTRENMAEFSRAGKAAKLMRSIFRDVTINAKDKITQARLLKVFARVIATDPVNERGERTVNNGDLLQLQGFHFNVRAGISDSFFVRCPVSFNRTSGQATITIPAFVPRIMVQNAPGTTHFRIVAAAGAVNFDTERYEYAMQGTTELPYTSDPTTPATLTLALPPNSTDTVVVALGIEYYQRVNSRSYALKTGEHNATSVILVDKPVAEEV